MMNLEEARLGSRSAHVINPAALLQASSFNKLAKVRLPETCT